ncbi:MAG: hypothetical protein B6226_04895 [Candidatus Cloacimonetes bacterium 4572_65]|nr:MAG: hypothetical protein B6226_04895 [Candidatus Cloacimonetes bacterium 4572_65]
MKQWDVIKVSKAIESQLKSKYGASGKGLHSKLSSVESKLDPKLVKKIRYIATIRNKLVHDESVNKVPHGFRGDCTEVLAKLGKKKLTFKVVSILLLLILLVICAIWYLI